GDLVLSGARESAICLDVPQRIVIQLEVRGHEDGLLELIGIVANEPAPNVLQFHDPGQLLAVDPIRVENHAIRIGQGDGFGAEVEQFLDRVLRNVATAGNQAQLAFQRVFAALEHLRGKIHAAIARSLRTNQRTAPIQALAGQHAREFILETLVLAEQVPDFAAADPNVSCRYVSIRPDVPEEFGHKTLAESHDFVVALALGIEVGSAFAAAHGQRSQRILQNLFKCQEFQNAKIDRRMEA